MRTPRPEFLGLTKEEIKTRLKAEKAEYDREYRKANAERIRARKLEDNKSDKGRARQQRYEERHKERLAEKARIYSRAYYAAHKEEYRQYRIDNREKINFWSLKRHAAKLQRTPKWLTEEDLRRIEEIHAEAVRITEVSGIRHEVDHILPMQGRLVSGLHVPGNLRVIPKKDNAAKSNRYEVE